MARKPRKAAANGKAKKARKASGGRRGVSPLALVIFLLVLAAGAGVAWLSFTYQPPLRPGMPGNDLVLELGDEAKAVAKPKAGDPAAGRVALAHAAKDDDQDGDTKGDDHAAGDKTGHAEAPMTDDHAADDSKTAEHKTDDHNSGDQGTGDHGTQAAAPAHDDAAHDDKPADAAASPSDEAPASTDHAAATPDSGGHDSGQTADHGATETPDQGTADQGTTGQNTEDQSAPAPQGQPQRQPVGQQTAMRLNVPQPSAGIRPRVAIVLTGLGLSKAQTNAAIQALPANITFAFSPYGNDLQAWADQAREAGHEVLLELPMEPHGFPNDDPGPHTLLTSLTESENVERMTWVLDRFTGYVGVTSQLGGRFTTQPEALRPILAELKKRGLLFLDTRASPDSIADETAIATGLAHATNDVFLDEAAAARAAIQAGLAEVERLARERGSAIGIGYPFPVTMEMLANWARDLESRNIELLPVSALARLPEAQ